MGLRLRCLLLCAAALAVSGGEVDRWSPQSLPLLLDAHTELLNKPLFRGQEGDEERGGTAAAGGAQRQRGPPRAGKSEQERILGYETVYENGTCTHTDVTLLQGFNETAGRPPPRTRSRRQVYGSDGRFVISGPQFITSYPFSAAVRLSTGCSGVLVSPKHVLTAAHCIHDGRYYLESTRRLRVGVLQLKARRGGKGGGGGGKRRGGRRLRGGRKREGGTDQGKREMMENEVELSGVEGAAERGRRRGGTGGETGEPGGRRGRRRGGGRRGRGGAARTRRSADAEKQTVLRWTRVKQTRIPQGWISSGSGSTDSASPDYDYALLELKRPIQQKHMELGVAPSSTPLTRIHFSGYDADKSLPDGLGGERVVYRFCSVAKESGDLLYQHCDAQRGATGAGVYIRLRRDVDAARGGEKGRWQRRVIGVFSGHRWVEVEGGEQRDFNVAVRITAPKYAQICHWIHGDPGHCREV